MKKVALLFLIILLNTAGQLSAEPQINHDSVHLQEVGIFAGYTMGNLKPENGTDDDFSMVPIFLHFGWDMNALFGLEEHRGTIQFALQPFVQPITNPDSGVAVGLGFAIKYAYPVTDLFGFYLEGGAGPMYFGVDTFEQNGKGFEFHDHGGGGIQIFIDDNQAITLGYRRIHISDAGIDSDSPNAGINGDSFLLGWSKLY